MKCPTTGKATKESIPTILLTRRFTKALADDIRLGKMGWRIVRLPER